MCTEFPSCNSLKMIRRNDYEIITKFCSTAASGGWQYETHDFGDQRHYRLTNRRFKNLSCPSLQ